MIGRACAGLATWALLVGSAVAATSHPVSVAKLSPLVRQSILSAAATIRDRGTTGLRFDLEACYRQISLRPDQTKAIRCITQDRYAWAFLSAAFPNAGDPYFNERGFASRGAKATVETVAPGERQSFIAVLGAIQDAEMKNAIAEIDRIAAADGH